MAWQQEHWDKQSQADRDKFGSDTEGMARVAAGFYGDEMAQIAKTANWITNSLLPQNVHGGRLDEDHADVESGTYKPPELDVGNLDKTEDRMALLDKLTQNKGDGDAMSQGRCGSTALMAAAIHAGGNEGIAAMLAAVKKGADPEDEMSKSVLKGFENKMKKGELTSEDLSALNDELYYQLRQQQLEKFEGQEVPAAGLDPSVLQDFIKSSPEMTKYFKDGKMSIDSVDTDDKEGANHFVLSVGGQTNGFVYDPYARKDGHQVVVNPVDVRNYHNKETTSDRIDAADFGGNPFDGMY